MSQEAVRILERLEAAHAAMEAFLEEERGHLADFDWEALAEDQERRAALTEEISAADAERAGLGRRLGAGAEAKLGDLLPGDPSLWDLRRERLRELVARVRQQNDENTRLIREAMERNERLLLWLTGEVEENRYTAEGQAKESVGGSSLFSRKV
ncbi:flagellar protein FlgN [Thiohalorhabdus methylotrophus]|uniref:Flagellar protein FlgN n=1 Tax=Thiohalorhabdus methylotrophus TaxID=3242694 RepID=A0ABV4TW66_9GAMM